MQPELVNGTRKPLTQSDIYSLAFKVQSVNAILKFKNTASVKRALWIVCGLWGKRCFTCHFAVSLLIFKKYIYYPEASKFGDFTVIALAKAISFA